MNEKMSNYKPLSSNIELPTKKEDLNNISNNISNNNLNNISNNISNNNLKNSYDVNNIQKVKYQDFLPVSRLNKKKNNKNS